MITTYESLIFDLKIEIPDDEPQQIVCTSEVGEDYWSGPGFGCWENDDFSLDSDENVGEGARLFVNRRIVDAMLDYIRLLEKKQ